MKTTEMITSQELTYSEKKDSKNLMINTIQITATTSTQNSVVRIEINTTSTERGMPNATGTPRITTPTIHNP